MIVKVNGYRGVLVSMELTDEDLYGDDYYDVTVRLPSGGTVSFYSASYRDIVFFVN